MPKVCRNMKKKLITTVNIIDSKIQKNKLTLFTIFYISDRLDNSSKVDYNHYYLLKILKTHIVAVNEEEYDNSVGVCVFPFILVCQTSFMSDISDS